VLSKSEKSATISTASKRVGGGLKNGVWLIATYHDSFPVGSNYEQSGSASSAQVDSEAVV